MMESAFRVMRKSAVLINHDGEHEFAVVADLPVGFAVFVAVCHEESIVAAVERVDADPAGKGKGREFTGKIDADAGAGRGRKSVGGLKYSTIFRLVVRSFWGSTELPTDFPLT